MHSLSQHLDLEHSQRVRQSAGFALIFAMSLMAFLLVLMLGLTALTMVETNSSRLELRRNQAQQEALLGMYVALGELQKHAGPDQRVTASAELLDVDPSTEAIETGGPFLGARKWTGVWETQNYDLRDGNVSNDVKANPFWLISYPGNESDRASLVPTTKSPDQEWVDLLDPKYGEPVEAAFVETSNTGNGFAWWIGDEGVKASVFPAQAISYSTERNAEYLAPAHSGYPLVKDSADNDIFDTGLDILESRDIALREQMRFGVVSGQDASFLALYHDISPFSSGLLTDSRRGGLKYDLSAALKDPTSSLSGPILTESDGVTDSLGGLGPTWDLVRDFWSLRNDATDGVVQIRGHRSRSWNSTLYNDYNRMLSDDDSNTTVPSSLPAQNGVAPIVVSYQVYFYASLELSSGGGAFCRLHYLPQIKLWNPYNVALTGDLVFAFSGNSGSEIRIMVDALEVPIGDAQPSESSSKSTVDTYRVALGKGKFIGLYNNGNDNDLRFRMALPTGGLQPGASVVYTLDKPVSRPGGRSNIDLVSYDDAGLAGASVYEDLSLNVNSGGALVPDFTKNNYYFNLRFYRYRNTGGMSQAERFEAPANALFSFLGFRLYSLSSSDDIEDLIQYENYTTISNLPGFEASGASWSFYCRGLIPAVTGFQDTDRIDFTSARTPAFGIEVALELPELNTYEASGINITPNPYVRRYSRIYADINLRAARHAAVSSSVHTSHNLQGYNDYIAYLHNQTNPMQIAYYPMFDIGPSDIVGVGRMTLFDIPSANIPIHSIAQLSQVNLADSIYASNYQIGNSFTSPFLDLDTLVDQSYTEGTKSIAVADWSYLANDSLWDRYFFSTSDLGTPLQPLVHPLYELSEEAVSDTSLLDSPEQSAAQIRVRGAFNVNSTSVQAWKALLGVFYKGNGSIETNSGSNAVNDGAPYIRTQFPQSKSYQRYNEAQTTLPVDEELYSGYRILSSSEIDVLAEKIVEQVKLRGPFYGVSEFVNRKYVPDASQSSAGSISGNADIDELSSELELMGALQAAIEQSGLNSRMNQVANTSLFVTPDDSNRMYNNSAVYPPNKLGAAGSVLQDAPGYLSQIDLLSRLGSILTARSDVFTIRSYGRVMDAFSDKVEAEAFLEALVERTVEPVNASNGSPYEPANPQSLGRKFRIVGFRWINPKDR